MLSQICTVKTSKLLENLVKVGAGTCWRHLHQLIDKKCSGTSTKSNISGVFSTDYFWSQSPTSGDLYYMSKLDLFLKAEKFKMETPETIRNVPPTRGVGYLNRFQGMSTSYPNTGTIQEIYEISSPGSDIPVQSTAFRSVHSTLGVYCSS